MELWKVYFWVIVPVVYMHSLAARASIDTLGKFVRFCKCRFQDVNNLPSAPAHEKFFMRPCPLAWLRPGYPGGKSYQQCMFTPQWIVLHAAEILVATGRLPKIILHMHTHHGLRGRLGVWGRLSHRTIWTFPIDWRRMHSCTLVLVAIQAVCCSGRLPCRHSRQKCVPIFL